MLVQKLILENRKTISSVLRGLVALPRVGAAIANHETFEVDFKLAAWKTVHLINLFSKIRNIDSCIALSCDVELVVDQVGEFAEKGNDRSIVVVSNSQIVIGIVFVAFAEAHLSNYSNTPPGLSK